ncbi:2-C-methyl-D-erythritol 4-phosphate cytidylyltransferase [Candidatus Azobacteroides pseudotrichonymphae]|jgi:2-C-methyl-D-erythritol 4-phosphate cytidylyltransferase|uniref:2-C-methyl-D-erythritol 4-phosphate cytidylyltransferase n=1 Tax=Azobacteroides pseudotrichonymphae genomovar. CFP2 TaxID=511995 RepID=ISPD_AZOPC|nr:2-C-methyl-D-erythritol 4-phosphate cytidylyltransferase [Candidatus Azobacteroides pseudotrichonymphae]B6YQA2.1 RecName: Full=2-C-methyl-D-erythritol 4-phosphate cytidylyltransferase; AltName: Full=4-diphosphocytidyl-2C-methyl-D-erythritol synthase; AltName: Full=MEP cytidylyltransferase; Short=MCT [Candidatus Azobacteroides pseudotrichonymphae genomovar. CFP2]BAG83374.1 2-C-methyl-D-erythritol 4-phosphate cytidylyltransferase [Candidatus Azobacteroides pseudotrichonymphae genomovar. CFP2]
MKQKYVIIVAGGNGLRMKATIPKQFLLLKGKPILMHTIEAFYRYDTDIHIILVLSEKQKTYWTSLCQQYNFKIDHHTIEGGITRFYSVKNGLFSVKKNCLVAVHDGVRPLVREKLIDNAFKMAQKALAVYPAIPITDSLREITNRNNRTVNRSEFYLVQTPQVFLSDILINAYEATSSDNFTDDISVVESGKICTPTMIKGSKSNIKITTPIDLSIAEALID